MSKQELFSTGDFISMARTTRNTLSHYDAIGLLPPSLRDNSNNYRYYSTQQLEILNWINILKELGMPLADIIKHKNSRTPELMDALLTDQIEPIEKKINAWINAKKLLQLQQKIIRSALEVDEKVMEIKHLSTEAIILGGVNDYSRGQDDYDALRKFYAEMREQYPDLNLNYPVWAQYRGERIKEGDWRWPDRYYFYNPEGRDRRSPGYYAVGYARGGYGQTDELYTRLTKYIAGKGYEISGDAYEEYPLNEFSVSSPDRYLIRVMISVREKA